MRIAICDDSKSEQDQFISALHGWDPSRNPECFFDGASLLEAAKQEPYFDIVFLDIYMPGENGIEIAGELKKISPETGIAFVTTSEDHAVDAFSLHALHYLVKPVTTDGIVESFRRLTQIVGKKRPMITFSVGHGNRTVYLDEICFLQSMNHAVEINLNDGRQLRVWESLNELEGKLDGSFLQLDRGTIVNMNYIEQMGIGDCVLRNGVRLGFPRRRKNIIRMTYDGFLFSRLSGNQAESRYSGR